ncbi:MAG TPA: DUF6498-containing protein [Casimicrobiaceae bacterium]|nr:DUF6498-containing protein [Casimicrobiaceae bacterium]
MIEQPRSDAPVLASDSTSRAGRLVLPPLAIAQIVARNIVPLAGVLFLGWHASSVLLLYFLDTMLAIAVLMAGLMGAMARYAPNVKPIGPLRSAAATLVVCVFLALPLGIPVFIILFGAGDADWREVFADPGLRMGALMQAAAALWSYRDFTRALRDHSPEELRVKRRFALVFLRWVGVLMVMYSSIGAYFPVVVIAAYIAITVWEEIAPDKFLLAAGDREDVDPAQRATTPGRAPPPRAPLRRRQRHRS